MKTPAPALSTSNSSPEHIAAYDRIVANATMLDLRLVRNTFEIKPQYYVVKDSEEDVPALSFNHVFPNVEYSAEDQVLFGEIHWSVTAKAGRTTLLKIVAVYLLSYAQVPDVGEDAPEAFMKRVGKYATYPYFRQLVAQLSWESKADLPILPVLK